eukprot:scaffold7241_cov178-Chaetoceros_neogracile.AAC.1
MFLFGLCEDDRIRVRDVFWESLALALLGMWKLGAGGRAAQVHVLSLLVSGMLMRAYLSSATAAEECQCVIIFVGSSSGLWLGIELVGCCVGSAVGQ